MSRTPDESRALAIFVHEYPRLRPTVVQGGLAALSPQQREEALEMFRQEWGREPDLEHGDISLPEPHSMGMDT